MVFLLFTPLFTIFFFTPVSILAEIEITFRAPISHQMKNGFRDQNVVKRRKSMDCIISPMYFIAAIKGEKRRISSQYRKIYDLISSRWNGE